MHSICNQDYGKTQRYVKTLSQVDKGSVSAVAGWQMFCLRMSQVKMKTLQSQIENSSLSGQIGETADFVNTFLISIDFPNKIIFTDLIFWIHPVFEF